MVMLSFHTFILVLHSFKGQNKKIKRDILLMFGFSLNFWSVRQFGIQDKISELLLFFS
jgi:hypothetical protein